MDVGEKAFAGGFLVESALLFLIEGTVKTRLASNVINTLISRKDGKREATTLLTFGGRERNDSALQRKPA